VAAKGTQARKSLKPDRPAIRQSELLGASNEDAWANPGKGGANLPVSEFPTYSLGRLTGIIRRSFMPAYVEPFGLTIPEWRVMASIAGRSLSFNEICRAITMDRAQVSRTLGTLTAKGVVAQLTSARGDRRGRGHGLTQTKLMLTTEGARTYQRILPIAQKHQMVLLSALDEQERSIVRKALRKMIAAAEQFEAQRSAKSAPRSKERDVSPKRGASRRSDRYTDSHGTIET
jgi:DNA-binding MarR family transcriptional regulator